MYTDGIFLSHNFAYFSRNVQNPKLTIFCISFNLRVKQKYILHLKNQSFSQKKIKTDQVFFIFSPYVLNSHFVIASLYAQHTHPILVNLYKIILFERHIQVPITTKITLDNTHLTTVIYQIRC
jgi:hypothetical protein